MLLPLAILLACAGLLGTVYLHTRPPTGTAVVHVDRVSQAVETTSSVKSFRFTMSVAVSAGGHTVSFVGNGSYDVQHKLVELTARANSPAVELTMVLDYSNGFVEYLRSQMLDGHLPAGKTWVKIDVGKLAKKAGIDVERFAQADSGDPTKMLDALRQTANPVEVGRETIGGITTTHYSATVDLRLMAAREADAAARESLERAIALTGTSSYPVDVWIDGKGYLRRVRMSMVEAPAGSSQVATMSLTEELSAFGAPARIVLPPGTDVADFEDLGG